jgi:hypothetical protein
VQHSVDEHIGPFFVASLVILYEGAILLTSNGDLAIPGGPWKVALMIRCLLGILVFCSGIMVSGCADRPSRPLTDRRLDGTLSSDYEILDVVLSDLIENKEFDPAVGGRVVKKPLIVLAVTTCGAVNDRLVESDKRNLKHRAPEEIWADLKRRNPEGRTYSLSSYHSSNPQILVRNLSKVEAALDFQTLFPDARGYVESFLPGYSPDGKFALFRFRFGPTPHGAVGHYLLGRERGHWQILWRSLGYYL